MSDDSSSSESRGPQPQGLQGALQWLVANVPEAVSSAAAAVEHGQPQPGGAATSSAPSSTSAPAMSEERRQFLANALSSLQRDYLADIKVRLCCMRGQVFASAAQRDGKQLAPSRRFQKKETKRGFKFFFSHPSKSCEGYCDRNYCMNYE